MHIPVSGFVEVTIKHASGATQYFSGKNLVTLLGQETIANMLSGVVDPISQMKCGASNLSPSKTQTALQGTVHETVNVDATASGNVITFSAEFGAGITSDVNVGEFGLFTSGGVMFARWVTVAFLFAQDSTVNVNWRLTIGGDE